VKKQVHRASALDGLGNGIYVIDGEKIVK